MIGNCDTCLYKFVDEHKEPCKSCGVNNEGWKGFLYTEMMNND